VNYHIDITLLIYFNLVEGIMEKNTTGLSINECFVDLSDPRMNKKIKHNLMDMITIMICAVISGANGWVEIEEYGKAKYDWFKTILKLPNGIPSHDTFGRLFALLATEELERCFQRWVQSVAEVVEGGIHIDGKQLRRSYDKASNKAAIHLVSAWASSVGLTLGQVKTEAKSNEITAIPELLKMLELKGCIVTLDAMGCQKRIVEQIVEQEGDYVLALKGNQDGLYTEVMDLFQEAVDTNFTELKWDYYETEEKNHGREEIRRYWTIKSLDSLREIQGWKNLNGIGMVESERRVGETASTEHRFYITSLDGNAKQLAQAVRSHWGIENSLHWILDVAFREDESRIRNGNAAENFSLLRRLALNLIKQEKSSKRGTQVKRMRAGWDNDYLLTILTQKIQG
jgi:predicted transposase YbfD/YdcC